MLKTDKKLINKNRDLIFILKKYFQYMLNFSKKY